MSGLAFLAFAALTAAADPPPRSADAAVMGLFDAVCVRGEEAPAGFQPVGWSAFPGELRFMNTYNHSGTFLRGEADGRTLYVARTAGPSHDGGSIGETRCGVAIRGANFNRLTRTIGDQLRVRPVGPISIGGLNTTMFPAAQGAISVSEAEGGWIIVRALGVSMPGR